MQISILLINENYQTFRTKRIMKIIRESNQQGILKLKDVD